MKLNIGKIFSTGYIFFAVLFSISTLASALPFPYPPFEKTATPTETVTPTPEAPSPTPSSPEPGDGWQAPLDSSVTNVSDNGVKVFRSGAFSQMAALSAEVREKINAGLYSLIVYSSNEIRQRLSKIYSMETVDGVLRVGILAQVTDVGDSLQSVGAKSIHVYDSGIATFLLAPDRIPDLANLSSVVKIEPDYLRYTNLDVSVPETNVQFVHNNCDLLGQGVTVGVLDTGIDVNHQDFYDSGMNKIAWYYSEGSGATAAPIVTYPATGANEWNNGALNTAAGLASATANAPDVVGHGSHVAGIAASTGNDFSDGISYIGVAPASPLVDVQIAPNGSAADSKILYGLWYFFVHHGAAASKMVANLSFGGPFGPHDGTSLLETGMTSYVTTNHFVVAAAGNDGPFTYNGQNVQEWHADQTVAGHATGTEVFNAVAYGGEYLLDGWYNSPANFTITVTDPCGISQTLSLSGVSPVIGDACGLFEILKSGSACDRNFQILILPFVNGGWTIQMNNTGTAAARFDIWTGPNGSIPPTAAFSPYDRFGSESVPGTARNVITVDSYITKANTDSVCGAATSFLGDLSGFSGLGPTRAGCGAPARIKPDVSAPGEYIMSVRSQEAVPPCSTSPSGHHMVDRGTSMAAPHVTGLLALYLQQAGAANITYAQMVNLLATNSRVQPAFPGDPNPGAFNDAWGHGKMWITCVPTPTPTNTPICSNCFWTDAQNANLVEGQPNFTSNTTSPVSKLLMNQPAGVFQAGNVLVVSDLANNRVLIYTPNPAVDGAPAVKVLGQTSWTGNLPNQGGSVGAKTLSSPKGVWTDGTVLIVTDTGNNRVLIYNDIATLPTFNGSANLVVGQTTMTTNGYANGPTNLNGPQDAFYYDSRLYISDNANNRVLVYLGLPIYDGTSADYVIGQTNFTINSPNQGLGVSGLTLFGPDGIWCYNGSLFVADAQNNRVLVYNNINSLSANDPLAETVVGQTSMSANSNGNSTSSLNGPFGVAADNCQLYIADTLNERVLVYNTIPTGTLNPPADEVLGTGTFTGPTQNDLFPSAIAAVNHALYVADSAGDRVLRFGCSAVGIPTPTHTPTPTPSPTPTPTPICNPCTLTTDQNASLVIGEPNFTTASNSFSPVNASSLQLPSGVFQAGNNLIVSDSDDSRILIYNPIPTVNQPAASKVIGQSSFTASSVNQGGSPGANTLWGPSQTWSNGTMLIAADSTNHRILIYNNINTLPATNGSANVVVGQPNFISNQANQGGPPAANTLDEPFGVFSDGNILVVSDNLNNRVLVYNPLPVSSGASASAVIGQPNFTSSAINQGGSLTANTLNGPGRIWISGGNLYVADTGNNRVLVYDNIDALSTNDPAANTVIGQNNFTSNVNGVSANSLFIPDAVSVNGCQLFIADGNNSRVLIYNPIPTGTTNPPADVVLGQPNMTTGTAPSVTQANNFSPSSIDAVNGSLWLADETFNRVLQFDCQSGTPTTPTNSPTPTYTYTPTITPSPANTSTPTSTPTPSPTPAPAPTCNPCVLTSDQNAQLVIGQPNFTSGASSTTDTASSLYQPDGIFQTGNSIIVSDFYDNRVLIYSPIPSASQPAAVMEIGQTTFSGPSGPPSSNQGGSVGANTLASPRQVWSNGTTLIVADEANNRVLIYNNINTLPSTNGSASVVIGQQNFTSNQANQGGSVGPNTLNSPAGVFYDGQRLFISDNGNSRILVYNSLPVSNNASASEEIGQPNFTSNSSNQGLSGPTSQTLSNPQEIWVYGGSLFVAEYGNNRVLVFNNAGLGIDTLNFPLAPASAGVTADAVIGQNSFTTNAPGTSANSLSIPVAVSASNCELYIADQYNYRVLVYDSIPTGTTNPAANVVLGQSSFTSNQNAGIPQANNLGPSAVQAINGMVYVADGGNNRVLQFACQSGTGTGDDVVKVSALSKVERLGTPTISPTFTPTYTVTPTPTIGSLAVAAAPNISRNGEPIQFRVMLPNPGQVHLSIYNLVGEKVYQNSFPGNIGSNSYAWNVQNQAGQPLASGLYLYVIETDDGSAKERYMGKIIVLH
jgi:hypothetical protein